jgi:hypothetical protein
MILSVIIANSVLIQHEPSNNNKVFISNKLDKLEMKLNPKEIINLKYKKSMITIMMLMMRMGKG